MIITICSSLDFVSEINGISEKLKALGHQALLPRTAELVIKGEITQEKIKKEKESGEIVNRSIKHNSIKTHFEKIKNSDAILVLNFEKKGVKNYIGGAVFMEIGFAYGINKKIFLLNPVPDVSYKDEILAMQPVVLDGDLVKLKSL
ncbi:MAG TPA: hypothetical protein VJB06_04335 [archaeon]|nr:hypothetical protein [archaeon]